MKARISLLLFVKITFIVEIEVIVFETRCPYCVFVKIYLYS
jgi:hypothetical protein